MQSDNHKVVAELKEMMKVFEEPGWRLVVNQLLQSAEELKEAVLYSKDWGETQFLKGRVEQCRMVANTHTHTYKHTHTLCLSVQEP